MAMRKPITSATMRRSMTGARSRAEGAGFESLINSACEYYRTKGVADIEKTPEPMKPLGGADRSGRFLACYTKQAQPDYKGVLAGGTPEMLDELGKKLAESIQKAFSVPASEAKASEPMEFTVTTEEAAQSLARAVEADKSARLPAETVIREMEKGRQGASDRKTVRERLRDVFLSSSYR